MVLSGGLGALGSLVAAWLSAQDSNPHAPNLTLLGRSGRVADPHTLSILAECQNQVHHSHFPTPKAHAGNLRLGNLIKICSEAAALSMMQSAIIQLSVSHQSGCSVKFCVDRLAVLLGSVIGALGFDRLEK